MKYLLNIIAVFCFLQINAQTISDAYLLSNQKITGTARAGALGNAVGALGGDFTSFSINPAGIGLYRTSEFVITPVIKSSVADMTLGNNKYNDSKFQVKVSNIGFTGMIPVNNSNSGILSFNYGIGYNNLVDYNQNFYIRNNNSPASFLDDIVSYANNEALSNGYLNQDIGKIEYRDWLTKLAWDTRLIDPAKDNNDNDIDGTYVSKLFADEKVNQRKSFERSGGINEFVFSGGLNVNHKFYFGATLGFQDVNLRQISEYSETFGENTYTFGENYKLTGTGYNFKFGAIYKPMNNIRLGLAIHTPTYFVLKEEKEIYANSQLVESFSSSGTNIYEYNLYSPWKSVLSLAYIFGKKGLISFDTEYLDYSNMKYRRNSAYNDDLSDVNSEISSGFKNVFNIRAGAEYKITPQVSIRGGYQMYPNAQKVPTGDYYYPLMKNNSSVYSAGLGYSSNTFFADVTYSNSVSKYTLNEIQPNLQSMVLKTSNNSILFTLGFKF